MAQLGGAKYVDSALAAITDALSLNPLGFPLAGYGDIRIARTRLIFKGLEIVPALSLRFRIEPPSTVVFLHLEWTLPKDMEVSDEWPWL